MTLYSQRTNTPVGALTLVASTWGLVAVLWEEDREDRVRFVEEIEPSRDDPTLRESARQLTEYFDGTRTRFDLPLDVRGTTFQRAVWNELLRIPFGETRTYGDVARSLENPRAVRAVGAANGSNPLSIVLPCHRVIGANGALTGFAGGLHVKAWLLRHEGGSDDRGVLPRAVRGSSTRRGAPLGDGRSSPSPR